MSPLPGRNAVPPARIRAGFRSRPFLTLRCLTAAWALAALGFLAGPEGLSAPGWSPGPDLNFGVAGQTATLLPGGKVLIAGGGNEGNSFCAFTYLFDPSANTLQPVANLGTARAFHTATLLPNGTVLVAGGTGASGFPNLSSAELYDPASNTWSPTGSLATERSFATATLLPNGKVLVAGGTSDSVYNLSSCELYDPTSGTWSAAGSLAAGRVYHTATLLQSGKVLAAGGADTGTLASAELYDSGSNSWSPAGSLASPRAYFTATLLPSGSVLAAGGVILTGDVISSAELYNPAGNSWSPAAPLLDTRDRHAASLLPNGTVLVTGGTDSMYNLSSAEVYDPAANTWTSVAAMAATRYFHTSTLVANGDVLVTGGVGLTGFSLSASELFGSATLPAPTLIPAPTPTPTPTPIPTQVPTPTPTPTTVSAPDIVGAPLPETANAAAAAAFWAVATGTPPLTYQWNVNGAPIAGATTALLTLTNLQAADAGDYTVTVSNAGGSVTSVSATLTVNASNAANTLVFSLQPAPQTVAVGSTVVFRAPTSSAASASKAGVSPKAAAPVTYQWLLNGVPLPNAAASTLVLTHVASADIGSYACVAAGPSGAVVSAAATLNVVASADPGRLINVSCRAAAGTGAGQLIAGYVVGGQGTSGSQPVLVRVSGPALTAFGVAGVLSDPEVALNNPGGVIASNDGWGGNAQVAAVASSVGAFSWTSAASHDSALVESLPGGNYTAQVAGASGDAGVALVEVYDATAPGAYTVASPRLVNISVRVQVGSGANILIAGFVVGGDTSQAVLIRASGPALNGFGLSGTLSDPGLQLFRSNPDGSSTLIETNTGWGGDAQIAATAALVGAFSWGSVATADSALLVSLPPGAYTAEVAGASGDTGISLVEVYEVH